MTPGADDLLGRLCRFTELRLAVEPDHALGRVQIDVQGLHEAANLVMAPNHAIDLAGRLIAACTQSASGRTGPAGAGIGRAVLGAVLGGYDL